MRGLKTYVELYRHTGRNGNKESALFVALCAFLIGSQDNANTNFHSIRTLGHFCFGYEVEKFNVSLSAVKDYCIHMEDEEM